MNSKLIVLACLLAVSQARYIQIERPTDSFRILNGSNAQPVEFPYQVSLQEGIIDVFRHYCGGAIISDQWILTAAHCINDYYWFIDHVIVAGTHNISSSEESVQTVPWGSTFVHESFATGDSLSDIALIKLKYPLKFDKNTAPISLPKKDSEPTGPVILAGWGRVQNDPDAERPAILQKANLEIIDRKTCSEAVAELSKKDNKSYDGFIIDETNICTRISGGSNPCKGDSGGPLVKKNENGQTEIVGIASWTIMPCGRKGAPTVYTKVSSYIDWIEKIMSEK